MQDLTPPALVVEGLKAALDAHAQGRLLDIRGRWDEAAAADHDDDRISVALNLWESWSDAAVHQWQNHGELTADDWPRMALHVLDALQNGKPITDPIVLAHFGPDARAPSPTAKRRVVATFTILSAAVATLGVLAKVADALPGLTGLTVTVVSLFTVPVLTLIAIRTANRRIEQKTASSKRA